MSREQERKKYEIQLNVENENDLYNSFDKFNNSLSDDVYSYINNKTDFSHITDTIKINISSKNKIDNKKFVNAYNKYINEQINLLKKESKFNTTKQIWLLCIGVLFIGFSLMLNDKINVILLEIISTIGSFSVWESANSFLIERKILAGRKLKLIKLKNAELNFN